MNLNLRKSENHTPLAHATSSIAIDFVVATRALFVVIFVFSSVHPLNLKAQFGTTKIIFPLPQRENRVVSGGVKPFYDV